MIETISMTGAMRSYTIHIHSSGVTDTILLYLTMPRELSQLSAFYQRVRKQSQLHDDTMVSVEMTDWNDELSPWEFQEPNARMSFAGGGKQFLADLEQFIVPSVCKQLGIKRDQSRFVIAGYSLAGLFSVWAMYQTKLFQGAVSCSGSLWYPGFIQYALEHELQRECAIYLSLGDKEEKVRNPYMAKVGEATRTLCQKYQDDGKVERMIFEWTAGNHFNQTTERMVKGMVWMLRHGTIGYESNKSGGKLE